MTFRTDREQTKWDSLQTSGERSINNILSGAATPEDIKSLRVGVVQFLI